MKISSMIYELERILIEYGDLEMVIEFYDKKGVLNNNSAHGVEVKKTRYPKTVKIKYSYEKLD